MKKLLGLTLVAALGLGTMSDPAYAGAIITPLTQDETPLKGPPISEISGPYDATLACLNKALSDGDRKVSYGVPYFMDATGKTNLAANDAAGTFLAQDYSGALATELQKAGVRVANISPGFQRLFDWEVSHEKFTRAQAADVGLELPDVLITGVFDGLDITGGKSGEVSGVATLGRRTWRMYLGFNSQVTANAFNSLRYPAGHVISTFGYKKQIVAVENEAGLTDFFFGGLFRSLISFNVDVEKREPLQYGARTMMAVVAYRSVRDVTGITSCDPTFQQAEMAAHVQTLAHTR